MVSRILFSSASVEWSTPRGLFLALDEEFRFDLDPCPAGGNEDGLSPLFCDWKGKRVFCNPPYGSGVSEWLRRSAEADVAVFLLPSRTDTRWFHEIVLPHAKEVRFLTVALRKGGNEHGDV